MRPFSTNKSVESRLLIGMGLFFSNKIVRFLLSLSVSIWMAGGCLFGCTNGVAAAQSSQPGTMAAEASCHAKRSHDCCHKPQPQKAVKVSLSQLVQAASFLPLPRGTMSDCPLSMNSTAATVKKTTHLPEPGRAPQTALPQFVNQTKNVEFVHASTFLPNRGPTHLRCCVFLI